MIPLSWRVFLCCLSAVLAVGLESLFLVLQLRGRRMQKVFGARAFRIHAWVTLACWIFFAAAYGWMQLPDHPRFHHVPAAKTAGVVLAVLGGILGAAGYRQLGWKRSLCQNFYQEDSAPVRTALFRVVRHPQDYGLWLLLGGTALATASTFNLLVFGLVVVLMIPHQRLENIPLKTGVPEDLQRRETRRPS